MTNKEKFLTLVSKEKTNTLEKNKELIKNRGMLRESQNIALKVLKRLDEIGWTQKKLGNEMGVTAQQITKIVKGQENLTLKTQYQLQEILDIPIFASYYENNKVKAKDSQIFIIPESQNNNLVLNKIDFQKSFDNSFSLLNENTSEYYIRNSQSGQYLN